MKYVLMFAADASAMADVDPAVAQEVYGRVYQWFAENAAVITDSGAELLGAETATTVKSGGVLVDGPFSEAKEVIGGFSVIDVPDLDAALDLAKSWPMLKFPGVCVEVRPMVVDYSQFE